MGAGTTGLESKMKAIVRHAYGSPDVLRLEDVPMPAVDDDGVLIRVRAASLNAIDWHLMRGAPLLARMGEGLRAPKTPGLGFDVAGEVEAVGKNVTGVRPGDAVFGSALGAFAEYVRGQPDRLVPKPANISFEQSAATGLAGRTALQGLRDKGQLEPGQRVLINGAGGGVGTFAVQIAKALGGQVTAVCGTHNVDLVRSLGADRVIDYTREDFTRGGQRFDLIVDVAANRSLAACARVLAPDGTLVVVGAAGSGRSIVPIAMRILGAKARSRFGRQRMSMFMAKVTRDDLVTLAQLIESGKVTPVIDRTYPLSETAAAMRYLEARHARGKVVITM
jgi:NADPH:quinone reductase-like Zn-dependent oxidoreductase